MSKAKFILSKSKVTSQYALMLTLADLVSYSLKTNHEVGKILEENTNCGFSVHSINAAKLIEDKLRIWFFCQGLTNQNLDELFELGITKFVVDNKTDLRALTEYCEKNNKKIDLLLRMKLQEHTLHTGKHFVFGMYTKQINEIVPSLREKTFINNLGIHFHRKTQNISEWDVQADLESGLTADTLEKLDIVNIGGGLPVKYKNFREEVLKSIFLKIKELKNWLHKYNIKVIVEPGRIIAASAVKLECAVTSIYSGNVIVNCSVWNSAMDTFLVHNRLLIQGELEKSENAYTIKGCTPDSLDIFRYRVFLPKLKIGDKITFLNAGAYNFRCDFCSLPKILTVIVK